MIIFLSCIDCKVPQNAVRQIKFINKVSNFRRIKSMCQNVDGILKNISHFTAKSVIEENFYNFSLSSMNVIFLALWGATRYKKINEFWTLKICTMSLVYFFSEKRKPRKKMLSVSTGEEETKKGFSVLSRVLPKIKQKIIHKWWKNRLRSWQKYF